MLGRGVRPCTGEARISYRPLLLAASRTCLFSIPALTDEATFVPVLGGKAAYCVPLATLNFLNLTPTRNRNLAVTRRMCSAAL